MTKIIPRSLGFRFQDKMRPDMNSLTLFWMEWEPLGLLCTPGRVGWGLQWAELCFTHASAHPEPEVGTHSQDNEQNQRSRNSSNFSLSNEIWARKTSITVSLQAGFSGIRTAWNGEEEKSSAEFSRTSAGWAPVLHISTSRRGIHPSTSGVLRTIGSPRTPFALGHPSIYLLSWFNY